MPYANSLFDVIPNAPDESGARRRLPSNDTTPPEPPLDRRWRDASESLGARILDLRRSSAVTPRVDATVQTDWWIENLEEAPRRLRDRMSVKACAPRRRSFRGREGA